MVGLGDIARKAYLPVIMNRTDITPYLFARDPAVLADIGDQYRVPSARRLASMPALLKQPLQAVFVHAATMAHRDLVRPLLAQGIPVYVDKPLDNFYENSRDLVEAAKRGRQLLMVGFNRRRAPLYRLVQADVVSPAVVFMQKNRMASPQATRPVIYDDFIHVVDTLRFLMGGAVEQTVATGRWHQGQLASVVVQLTARETTGVGIMNRMNGTDEEVVEVMGTGVKWRVREMREGWRIGDAERRVELGGWATVAEVKGFAAIVDEFLTQVRTQAIDKSRAQMEDALITHQICEAIITQLEAQQQVLDR